MTTRPRGRPRSYDPDAALDAALNLFWSRGFAGTTLDALSDVTGMKRPSLYAAFGDKGALFETVIARFTAEMAERAAAALALSRVDDALEALALSFVDMYAPASGPSRGCLVFSVASLEAAEDERLRQVVGDTIERLDGALRERLDAAVSAGELPAGTDTDTLARCLSSQLHSLSLRGRAGGTRRALRKLARGAVTLLLCGARASGARGA
ncbi:MAG: TetR/AcrR family transcriptional regulator [Polyangiales bacterium]|nr:TetR/AcrR family transcriptional regulator [Myxococcales bacterium]MCB9662296.1 TetR/AcrR family transcriptional regulator [Sandaracinaceae bacterium]